MIGGSWVKVPSEQEQEQEQAHDSPHDIDTQASRKKSTDQSSHKGKKRIIYIKIFAYLHGTSREEG